MAWGFTHEFHHAFDAAADISGTADLISATRTVYSDMPYAGQIIDAGEHYDWEAQTLRLFTGFDTLAGPFSDYLEVDDPDGDRLASADARVPMDERASSPTPTWPTATATASTTAPNTRQEGSGRRTRPWRTPTATARTTASIPRRGADRGEHDRAHPGDRRRARGQLHAVPQWCRVQQRPGIHRGDVHRVRREQRLHPGGESQSASLFIHLDGSGGNGFWQGENTYSFSLTPGQPQPRNHTSRHGTTEEGVAPAGSALVTRTVGSTTILEARIPRANLGQGFGWTGGTTTGFSTSVGTVLGLRHRRTRRSAAWVTCSASPGRPSTSTSTSTT